MIIARGLMLFSFQAKTGRVKSIDRHTRDPFIGARDLNARRYLVLSMVTGEIGREIAALRFSYDF